MTTTDPWLVVGLGNPGAQYETTRHNVGQLAVDDLLSRVGGSFSRHKANAMVATMNLGPHGVGGTKLIVMKPLSYMNTSGGPTHSVARYFDIPAERLIVIHDELDIEFGTVRLKCGGGEGGHNGLKDISKAFGTKDYYRIRIGVGRPPGRQSAADYVLRPFGSAERTELPIALDRASDAVELLVKSGLVAAQQDIHSRA